MLKVYLEGKEKNIFQKDSLHELRDSLQVAANCLLLCFKEVLSDREAVDYGKCRITTPQTYRTSGGQ